MKKTLVKLFIASSYFTILFLTPAYAAAAEIRTANSMAEYCEGKMLTDVVILPPAEMGIGARGVVDTRIPITTELELAAPLDHLSVWRLELYPVRNLEEARAHVLRYPDADMDLYHGYTYLVHPEAGSVDLTRLSPAEARAIAQRWLAEGTVFETDVVRNGANPLMGRPTDASFREVSRERIDLVIDPERAFVRNGVGLFGPCLAWNGWVAQRMTGLINFTRAAQSSTFKNIARNLRGFLVDGGRVDINQNNMAAFEEGLVVLRNTERTRTIEVPVLNERGEPTGEVTQQTVAQDASLNRFASEEALDDLRAQFRAGALLSIEVRDASGRVVAVVPVKYDRELNRLEPDTVGYLPGWVDATKWAFAVIMTRAASVGIVEIDVAMTTPLTAGLGAVPVPRPEFIPRMNAIRALGPGVPIDMSPVLPRPRLTPQEEEMRRRAPGGFPWWSEIVTGDASDRLSALLARDQLRAALGERGINADEALVRVDQATATLESPRARFDHVRREIEILQAQDLLRTSLTNSRESAVSGIDPAQAGVGALLNQDLSRVIAGELADRALQLQALQTLRRLIDASDSLTRTSRSMAEVITSTFGEADSAPRMARYLGPDSSEASIQADLQAAGVSAQAMPRAFGRLKGDRQRILGLRQEVPDLVTNLRRSLGL